MNGNGGFFTMLDNELVRSGLLKPHELAVYANLKSRKGNKRTAWPSHSTIAKETSMSQSTVKTCIKELQSLGLIEVSHRYLGPGKQTSNEYRIFDKSRGLRATGRWSHCDYEEYSLKNDSNTKSSTKSNKRKWEYLKPGAPATEKQKTYILDLQDMTGGYDYIHLFPELSDIEALDQVQADQLIELLYVQMKQENRG